MAIDADAGDLAHLDPAIQKVEFKITVLAGDEAEVQAVLHEGGPPTAAAQGVLLRHQGPRALRREPRAPRPGDAGRRRRLDRQIEWPARPELRQSQLAADRRNRGSSSTWWETSRFSAPQSSMESGSRRHRRSRGETVSGRFAVLGKQEQLIADYAAGTGSRCMSLRCSARSTRASGTSTTRRDFHTRRVWR